MDMPQVNISEQGEVPRTLSVFRMELSCTGKLDFDVTVLMQLNMTVNTSKNITVLNFKRRKMCHKKLDLEVKLPISDKNNTKAICNMKRIELEDSSISNSSSSQGLSQPSTQTTQYLRADTPNNATPITSKCLSNYRFCIVHYNVSPIFLTWSEGYPTLRIEKNDLKSVTLMEAKAKVKDIAISRERITLKDVLQEGTFGRIFHGILIEEKDPSKEKQVFVKTVKGKFSTLNFILG
ncbi:hypothetical protein E2320_008863 [Naja naja]|nr:hypothetical protein E2320_008863 [Naja naja]